MNYRHAFHAGNFADCFKHALLVALIDALRRKPAPFFVLDTHAGVGRYDLNAAPAQRSREADKGIHRLLQSRSAALLRYLQLVETLGLYPGSPLLTRALLRGGDRLVCCELHPADAMSLRVEFSCDPQVVVHDRSGWEAVGALLPPKERRGLVFIDPPFENADEFLILANGLSQGNRRFAHGMFAAWYPVKQRSSVRSFHTAMKESSIRNILAIELCLREPINPSRLNGCGLLLINPPFGFEDQGRQIANAVFDKLGADENGAGVQLRRITDE